MSTNIDLTKILKNCPKGFKLYSLLHGEVSFRAINEASDYPIIYDYIITGDVGVCATAFYLTSNGTYSNGYNGECILFPSKDQRDWSKFTVPRCKKERFDPKTLKPFDKVLVKCTSIYNSNLVWRVGLFSYFHVEDDSIRVYTLGSDDNAPNSYVIPYNDDTKYLANTTEEAPEYYRYWEN